MPINKPAANSGLPGVPHDHLTEHLTGQLLIASPTLSDSLFAQTVIYLCAHSPEDGAMGLIVNRRLSQPSLEELLSQLDIGPNPPTRRISLCQGGPVDQGRGFILHSSDWSDNGSLNVDNETMLTASLEALREIAAGNGPRNALLALGHTAWEAGQLEEEMIRDNAWLVAPATEALVFGPEHTLKWRRALATINLDPLTLPDAVGHA